tara:strand:+ start:940 stop:1164 length:225 start_codon:yes stop_codon:yes gene_type:complete
MTKEEKLSILRPYLKSLMLMGDVKESVVRVMNEKVTYIDLGFERVFEQISFEEKVKIELEIEFIMNQINQLENE